MTAGSISVRYRRWFGPYLLFVATVSTVYGFLNARRGSGWAIGEWLTNYSAGFIRRGLVGEVVLLLGRASGINLVWIVFGIQVAVYVIFLWCVYRLTDGLRWGWMVAALLLSPATLGFIVLDPPNGFKKEILLFAALGAVICLLLYARLRDWQMAALLATFGAILALSHEPLLFYLPYIFAAVALHTSLKRALVVVAWPAILCGIAAIAVLLHPGDRAMAEKICTSVGGTLGTFGVADDSVCGGSITWLQESLAQAHANVMVAARVHHSFALYGLLAIPALLPADRCAGDAVPKGRGTARGKDHCRVFGGGVRRIASCLLQRTRLGPMDSHPCGMPDAASVDGEPRGAACGTIVHLPSWRQTLGGSGCACDLRYLLDLARCGHFSCPLRVLRFVPVSAELRTVPRNPKQQCRQTLLKH